jgi:hypothetical protein
MTSIPNQSRIAVLLRKIQAATAEINNAGAELAELLGDTEPLPLWHEFDLWAAEHLTPSELDHVRQLYDGPVPNDALGAIQGCDPGEASRQRVNRLNSDIRRKLPAGRRIESDGARNKPGQTALFGT